MEIYSELTGISGSTLRYKEYSRQALESRVDNEIASYKSNKFFLSEGPIQDISNVPSDFTLIKVRSDDESTSYILENLTDSISFNILLATQPPPSTPSAPATAADANIEAAVDLDFRDTTTIDLLNYKFRQSSDESGQVIDAILVDTKNNMIRNAASSPFKYDFKFSENRNAFISGSRGGGTSGGGGY
jgi:hypothetical protein